MPKKASKVKASIVKSKTGKRYVKIGKKKYRVRNAKQFSDGQLINIVVKNVFKTEKSKTKPKTPRVKKDVKNEPFMVRGSSGTSGTSGTAPIQSFNNAMNMQLLQGIERQERLLEKAELLRIKDKPQTEIQPLLKILDKQLKRNEELYRTIQQGSLLVGAQDVKITDNTKLLKDKDTKLTKTKDIAQRSLRKARQEREHRKKEQDLRVRQSTFLSKFPLTKKEIKDRWLKDVKLKTNLKKDELILKALDIGSVEPEILIRISERLPSATKLKRNKEIDLEELEVEATPLKGNKYTSRESGRNERVIKFVDASDDDDNNNKGRQLTQEDYNDIDNALEEFDQLRIEEPEELIIA
jgi:hypothetical protein